MITALDKRLYFRHFITVQLMIRDDETTDRRHITGSVILLCSRYLLEYQNESQVKCLTVERAHAVGGRRLLQGLLNLLPPLGFVLQSFLEFPLCLLLFLQTLLNDGWDGARQRVTHEWKIQSHVKLNI